MTNTTYTKVISYSYLSPAYLPEYYFNVLYQAAGFDVNTRMAATAEIKIGKRRVSEYFLSPLLQYSNESLRER